MGWQDRCCECSFWVKYILFSINFLIWLGGVCLIIIGSWSRLEKSQLGTVSSLTTDPAIFLIILGCIMFVTSISGCVGSLRENISLLKMFCLVVAVVFLLEVVSAILAFVLMDRLQTHLKDYMYEAIVNYQDEPSLKDTMDYLQKRFHCCGGTTFDDWNYNIYYNCSSPAQSRCGVPITCCRQPDNVQCGFQTRLHGFIMAANDIYTKGCVEALMAVFKDNLVIVGFVAFGVGFLELFAILLAHILIKLVMVAEKEYHEAIELRSGLCHVYNSSSIPSIATADRLVHLPVTIP